jgi:murein DD-endopeptidase MepM/ murein hydrolase activator NlpD
MSSLHPDRLTTDQAAPTPGTRRPRSQAPGTASRTAAASATTAPVKPLTTASGTSRSRAAVEGAKVARTVTAKTAKTAKVARTATASAARSAGVTAKAAGTKAAAARTAASARKAATPKQAAAKPAAAKATAAKATATKPAARTVTPKPAAAKPATAKAATAEPVTAKAATAQAATAKAPTVEVAAAKKVAAREKVAAESAPVRRPTPYKHTEVVAEVVTEVVAPVVAVAETPATDEVVVPPAEPTRYRGLHRMPSLRRRKAVCLAAALVGALSISAASVGDTAALAETGAVHETVSVADALGIEAEEAAPIVSAETTDRLGDLVASRAERDEAELQAARVQEKADDAARKEARRAAKAAAEAARPKAVLPVDGARFTSGYGSRWGTLHAGIDLAAPIGTPEYAAMDGVVLEAGPASGFGLAVYIQHKNGDVTVYGHMEKILVTAGQVVKAGDTISLLGNNGQSTGPHLHFEVHQGGINGTKIDPVPWLAARGVKVP